MKRLILLLICCFVAFGNVFVENHSILYEAIRDSNNRFVRDAAQCSTLSVTCNDPLALVVKMHTLDERTIDAYLSFEERARSYFRERGYTVISPALLMNYADEVVGPLFDRARVAQLVSDNRSIERYLASVDHLSEFTGLSGSVGTTYHFFAIALVPPKGTSEMQAHLTMTAFLENRVVPWHEAYLQPDTVPHVTASLTGNGAIGVERLGWLENRALLQRTSYGRVFSLVIPSVLLLSSLIALLQLRSVKQTLLVFVGLVLTLVLVRGTIGVLSLVGIASWENLITIMLYVPTTVASVSFWLRPLEEWNVRDRAWSTIFNTNVMRIGMAGVLSLSVADYLLLALQHYAGVQVLYQLGLQSVAAMVWAYVVARHALPALAHAADLRPHAPGGVPFSAGAIMLARFATRSWARPISLSALITIVCGGAFLYAHGFVPARSDPGEFMERTYLHAFLDESRTHASLPGAYPLTVVIQPNEGRPWQSALYTQSILCFVEEVMGSTHPRSILTPVLFFARKLTEDMGLPTHLTCTALLRAAQSKAAELDGKLSDILERTWYNVFDEIEARDLGTVSIDRDTGTVLMSLTSADTRSDAMERFRDTIVRLANDPRFSAHFSILVGNEAAQYPTQDAMISTSFASNTAQSIVLITILGAGYFRYWYRSGVRVALASVLLTVPFAVSTSAVICMMALTGMTLDKASNTIVPIVVSAAIDLPLFLIIGYLGASMRLTSDFVLFGVTMQVELEKFMTDFLANTSAFVLLAVPALAYFPLVERLGTLLVTAMVGCMLGTLLILPFLAHLRRARQ